MGNPSEGKVLPPDVECADCGDILIGKEVKEGRCCECQAAIAKDIAVTSDQEHLVEDGDPIVENEYLEREECVEMGLHLTSCDDDGYCNHCGEQE